MQNETQMEEVLRLLRELHESVFSDGDGTAPKKKSIRKRLLEIMQVGRVYSAYELWKMLPEGTNEHSVQSTLSWMHHRNIVKRIRSNTYTLLPKENQEPIETLFPDEKAREEA